MDEMFFEDFLQRSWREVVWVAWLAAIAPQPQAFMLEKLTLVRKNVSHNKWILDLAILSLKGASEKEDESLCHVYEFKRYLSEMPYSKLPLRRLSKSQIDFDISKQSKIREIYQSKGTDATIHYLNNITKCEFDLDYWTWVKGVINA